MTEQAKPQVDKFKELARELEADEDPARFEETVRKIAPRRLSGLPLATCMHCGCTFPASEGHVDDDAALCGECLHKD